MPDESDSQLTEPAGHGRGPSESGSRRLRITQEQRKVLGPARSKHDRTEAETEEARAAEPESAPAMKPEIAPDVILPPEPSFAASEFLRRETVPREREEPESEPEPPVAGQSAGRRVDPGKFARVLQMQNVALLLGAVFLLFAAFYVGKKFDYWKYQLSSQLHAKNAPPETGKYAGSSANELVDQAIVAERVGNWGEAVERLLTAKHKNLLYPGLLYRAAKLYYDHGDFDSADHWFERAVAFREDVGEASYYRGMIATGRHDYVAGAMFYEAAASASPFKADYFYSWAEALRRDHRPKEAMVRYQEAALRAQPAEENVCRFKARMAAIEAGDAAEVSGELDKKITAGPLPVDWQMTQAALQLQAGKMEEAIATVKAARSADTSLGQGHFAACAGDRFFTDAAANYRQLADALSVGPAPSPNELIPR